METKSSAKVSKPMSERMRRCAAWLVTQGVDENKVEAAVPPSIEDEEPPEDLLSIPTAVDEDHISLRKVPLKKRQVQGLRLECEWRACYYVTENYEAFQRHVKIHIPQLHVTPPPHPKYKCLWDICHHQTTDEAEIVRHINYHAYHAKLMAVGRSISYNLKLPPCKKDSALRNKIPLQSEDFVCRWVDCDEKFNDIQNFFTHVRIHVQYSESVCSWAGCGTRCSMQHIRSHLGERIVACARCGAHFANNSKYKEHLERQSEGQLACDVCGKRQATARLLRQHERQHVCVYACQYCDMTSQTLSALAAHIRFRHLSSQPGGKPFKCGLCDYTCVTNTILRRHLQTHNKKPQLTAETEAKQLLGIKKPPKESKKYICHMCPDGEDKVFSRGTRLTTHLVKKHGAQWPAGHCRFRYQKSEDGYYRLTTTRYESLEVSRQVMHGANSPIEPIQKSLPIWVKKVSSASEIQPARFKIKFDSCDSDSEDDKKDIIVKKDLQKDMVKKDSVRVKLEESLHEELMLKDEDESTVLLKDEACSEANIEITMCDVDEEGNIIRTKVVDSEEVVYESMAYSQD